MIFHEVKRGETLSSIAREYGTTVASLVIYNGIPNPENLAVGQCIVIVYPEIIHTVRPGESVYTIAQDYGKNPNAIYRNNPQLNAASVLYPGERIVIELRTDRIGSFETGGYTYTDASMQLIESTMPYMNYLMPFTYGFDENAELISIVDEQFINIAHTYGRKCFLHLSTLNSQGYFSSESAGVILGSEQLRKKLADNILAEIKEKGYDGLDVDFEFVPSEYAGAYAEYIYELRELLNSEGYEVFAALAPKTSDDQKGILYEGHIYSEIGEAANAVLLMTYEWGYTYVHLRCKYVI